jgi:hypothetical protein
MTGALILSFVVGAAATAVPLAFDMKSLGVGGVIAAITMYFYRVDHLDSEKRNAQLTESVITALNKNSETHTRLATLIEMDRHTGRAA